MDLGEFLVMDEAGFSHEVNIVALGFYLNISKVEHDSNGESGDMGDRRGED